MSITELPPLGFLPAFEAAARLGSFKAAAEALHVTPSAVSQQIKALEGALGVALFERHGRAVRLTEEGQNYAIEVRQALAELAIAGRRLKRRASEPVLRLCTVPFMAYEFLLPRLSDFRAVFPGFELRLETSMQVVDFDVSDIDAALRVGGGPWPNLATRPIGRSDLAVVCSPAMARQVRRLADVRQHTLIDVRGRERQGWRALLKARRINTAAVQWLTFETYFETMRAAEQGLGLAFGLFPLTTSWVEAGRLAVPFADRLSLAGHISLVHRNADNARFPFKEIEQWLASHYASLPPLARGRIV